jgi:chemotaxis protein MotB
LAVIYDVISDVTNYIRIRGYTDNQPIDTEIFKSNWELSVYRATAILHLLENLGLEPERMAIEGYGQFHPKADNKTPEGRAQNRRVVIAISKYGTEKENLLATPTISVKDVEAIKQVVDNTENENKIKIIRLKNGGIRITTRDESDETEQPPQ